MFIFKMISEKKRRGEKTTAQGKEGRPPPKEGSDACNSTYVLCFQEGPLCSFVVLTSLPQRTSGKGRRSDGTPPHKEMGLDAYNLVCFSTKKERGITQQQTKGSNTEREPHARMFCFFFQR